MPRIARKPRRSVLLGLFVLASVVLLVHQHTPLQFQVPRVADVLLATMTSRPEERSTLRPTPAVTRAPMSKNHVIAVLRMSAGRLGNDMFVYASLIGIADRNRMWPVYGRIDKLTTTFWNLSAASSSPKEFDPTTTTQIEYSAFMYDAKFETIRQSPGDVICIGFFQSWKYFRDVRSRVLAEFSFRSEHRAVATNFLADAARKAGVQPADAIFVGVHIRRGDMVTDRKYSIADDDYLSRAVDHVTARLAGQNKTLVFVVCSDDISWSTEHFDAVLAKPRAVLHTTAVPVRSVAPTPLPSTIHWPSNQTVSLNWTLGASDADNTSTTTTTTTPLVPAVSSTVPTPRQQWPSPSPLPTAVYSVGHTTEQDLALLAACNHTIMTVGTYGWWAGYLAGGITVYYKNFITSTSELSQWFSHDDFFPPEWVGL